MPNKFILRSACVIFSIVFSMSILAATIAVSSGNNQSGTVNSSLSAPLIVVIDCTDQTAIAFPCGNVFWSSSDSSDGFSQTTTPTAGSQTTETSSNSTLILGPNEGIRTITATASDVFPPVSVTFTVTATAVPTPTPTDTFMQEQQQQQAAVEQAATTPGSTLVTAVNGNAAMSSHLVNLHAGGTPGIDVSGIDLNVGGKALPVSDIQRWLQSGGSAGEDSG